MALRLDVKKQNIELYIDTVYINGVAFLVSIYRQMKHISNIHTTSHNEGYFQRY